MRRRKLLVALVGLAVVGAAGVVVLWPRPETERTARDEHAPSPTNLQGAKP